ncbi:MAG TPA: DNA polymerase IV [Acidimicrobiia bacterium]|nr:DNA polymerase IV [Acidimicrobiia bacterium]
MAPDVAATILHADLDAFYASVEQLLDPSLQGRPIAVGSGVVLAASYEAKAFGVDAGMPGWRARRLCPGLVLVGAHFEEYQRLGDAVIEVLRDFTPWVERVSIDEAFLDVAGSVHLFGAPAAIASTIRERVRSELGLPVSVGVATTKHLAKVASQVAKPDGLVVVAPGAEREFLDPLPVGLLWGVGPVTRARLAETGVRTIGQLVALAPATLHRLVGEATGTKLGSLAANRDPRRIETHRRAGSVGAQSALGRRVVTDDLLASTLGFLADRVGARLRAASRAGRTVTVRVRFVGLRAVTRSATLPWGISTTRTLTRVSIRLATAALTDHPDQREITLLAISVSNLVAESALQLELPLGTDDDPDRPGTAAGSARWALDRAMDQARARFGRDAVGHAPVQFRNSGGVPDAFRELAEADPDSLG